MKRKASVWSSCAHMLKLKVASLCYIIHTCFWQTTVLLRERTTGKKVAQNSLSWVIDDNTLLYKPLQYIFNIVLTRAQPLPTLESRKPVWIQRLGVCTGTVRSPNLHVSRPSLMKCAPSNWTSGIKLNHATVARYSKIYPSHAPWNVCLSFWCPRQRKIHRFFFATSRICRFTF